MGTHGDCCWTVHIAIGNIFTRFAPNVAPSEGAGLTGVALGGDTTGRDVEPPSHCANIGYDLRPATGKRPLGRVAAAANNNSFPKIS